MSLCRAFRVSLAAAAAAVAARLPAQSVRWDPPGGSLPAGETTALSLVFDSCSPDGEPVIPKVDGLTVEYQGQSSNLSIINGSFSRSVTLTYGAILNTQQAVDIPEFEVKTSKGPIKVPAAHFNSTAATIGSSGVALGDAASAAMTTQPESVWQGEVFDIKYDIDVASSYYPQWGHGTFDWDPSPLLAEDWSQPAPFDTRGATPRTGIEFHTRAIAPKAGRILLKPTSQLVSLSVGVAGFGFFQQRQYQQFAVRDAPVSIDVRPLPPAPSGFSGAVGDFSISSKIIPRDVKVGEPITWTIELSGSGNWPEIRGLPSREAPASFQAIQPKPKRTQPAGELFKGTLSEDVVLVPTSAGSYALPPLDFTYFDPKSGTYRTITAPGAAITAAAAPVAAPPGATAPAPGVPAVSAEAPAEEAKAPEEPAGALGDPTPEAPAAAGPVGDRVLGGTAAAPFALVVLLWFLLAYRRARASDPLREQRAARLRLSATLEGLKSAPAAGKGPLLIAWQRDAAILWGILHAAPPREALADAEWAPLWGEADRFLYGPKAVLSPDWPARAQAALAAKALRPFLAARLFLPRNLIPLAVLAAVSGAATLRASEGDPAYRRGDFAGAEKAWSADVAADPLDWSARHNLSLALAQQDRWGEAAAQAAAAFVQAPSEPATLRELEVAGDKAGFIPEPLDNLVQPGPVESTARLASPWAWRRAEVGLAWAFAASLCLLLAYAYKCVRGRWAAVLGLSLAAASLCGVAASEVAYRAYRIASDPRAVVVWRAGTLRSVPTEADVSQKTTNLPAGSIAVADRDFLGWIRLSFPNGETGWIRRSEAVYLWQSPRD